MKKTLLLFVMTLLSILTAKAYDTEINGVYYNLDKGAKQATVTSSDTKYSGRVTIPAKVTSGGVTYNVTVIGKKAFKGCSKLTSVIIPNSVTSIREFAFDGCSGLTSVTIPKSVTSIDGWTFRGCSRLKSVVIPNSVTSIGMWAFDDCSGLTSVTIPSSVTSIESDAFAGCSSLTSVTIPSSVTSIEGGAFRGCSGLKSVVIPNSVTDIGSWTFSGCSGLTSVTIPNSVTSIGVCAFWGCSGLKSIKIPNSVTSIGSGAFWNCSGLTSVTIPSSVTSIGDRIFWDCSSLKSISVESGNPKYNSYDNCSTIIETATKTVVASCNKTEKDTIIYKVNLQPSVFFGMGITVIRRYQEANVELIAKYANEHKDSKLLLQGFAYEPDCGAKTQKEWEAFQYIISKSRADNVKKMLVKKYLIDPDRIIAKGCGFTTKLSEEVEFNRVVLVHDITK